MEHLFSPNSSGHLRSDAHHVKLLGGDEDVDHTQTIGGDTVKLLGGYIPPGFRHPWLQPEPQSSPFLPELELTFKFRWSWSLSWSNVTVG